MRAKMKITKQITNRDNLSVDCYLSEISKYETISPKKEVLLMQRIKRGDEKAKKELIQANLRFVVSVAKQYQHNYMDLSDLISEGNIGLIIAAKKFDETKGFKFISFAVWWIKQSILQALSNDKLIRLPQNKTNDIIKIRDAKVLLAQDLKREPTLEEISRFVGMEIKHVKTASNSYKKKLSLVSKVSAQDADSQLLLEKIENVDSIKPDKDLCDNSLKTDIGRVLSFLSLNEKLVIEYYYGINGKEITTLENIVDLLPKSTSGKCYTTERVRQLKNEAINKMKNFNISLLEKYL